MPKKFPGATPDSAHGQLSAFEADQPAWSPEHNAQFWNQRAQQHQQLRDAADREQYGPLTGIDLFNKGWSQAQSKANPVASPGFFEALGPRVSMGGLASGMSTSTSQPSLAGLQAAADPTTDAPMTPAEQAMRRINPTNRRPV